ncbi:MAG: hypothetical protein WBZ36_05555 [Candidatus Nitrosopolaris sp.]
MTTAYQRASPNLVILASGCPCSARNTPILSIYHQGLPDGTAVPWLFVYVGTQQSVGRHYSVINEPEQSMSRLRHPYSLLPSFYVPIIYSVNGTTGATATESRFGGVPRTFPLM